MHENQKIVVDILDEIRYQNLYVHNNILEDSSFKIQDFSERPVYLVETLAILNSIVPNGTMLLYGGHGGGKTTLAKYLGEILLGKSEQEIEGAILRSHPQLTEEKILGSLNLKQLLSLESLPESGKIEVQWNDFVHSQWKIIDEVNRLNPYAQNILLSLLAEGIVKYHDQSKNIGNYTVFATMNPRDEGNYVLPLPFLDRFALALPITMPDYASLQTIGKIEKSQQGSFFISKSGLNISEIQAEVSEVGFESDAEDLINNIIAEYRLCTRVVKEASESITVDNGLCTNVEECRYFTDELVCSKIVNPLSVRVKQDLYRYGKALSWFLGDSTVNQYHIKAIAPYMIWHRSQLKNQYLDESTTNSIKSDELFISAQLKSTKNIIDTIFNRFQDRNKNFLFSYNQAIQGKLSKAELDELIEKCEEVNDDLVVKNEIYPELLRLETVYDKVQEYVKLIQGTEDIPTLHQTSMKLKREYKIRIRQQLANIIESKIARLKSSKFDKLYFNLDGSKLINSTTTPLLTAMLKAKYGESLDFSLPKYHQLSSSQDNYILVVVPLSLDNIKLTYQGPTGEEILNELKQINER